MNATLAKALLLSIPIFVLFAFFLLSFLRNRTIAQCLQVIGSGCLVLVLLAHLCEALNLFPAMRWGSPDSVGHYIDLWSAIAGLSLLVLGYLVQTFGKYQRDQTQRLLSKKMGHSGAPNQPFAP
jgi:hypothetical protein